jgi:hypothetical protein
MPRRRFDPLTVFGMPVEGGGLIPTVGREWFVNTQHTGAFGTGRSFDRPLRTMAEAFAKVATYDKIYVKNGVYENLQTPYGVNDVSIIGVGNKPRHDNLTNPTKKGAAAWRTASGVTASPLLEVRTQGWRVVNMLFAPPSGAPGIKLSRAASGGGVDETDSSHFSMIGCRVAAGQNAIENAGGAAFVLLKDNRFEAQTASSVVCTSTSIAVPLQWDVIDNYFGFLSASHILSSASSWRIKGNVFGPVASTAKYIDLTHNSGQGLNNMVVENTLAGVYELSDYVGGTGDKWLGNWVTAEGTTAPDGFTILPPD